jgi:hypothetical protein
MSRVLTFFCSLLIAVVLLPVQPGIAQVGVAAGEIEVLVNDSTVPRSDDPKHPNLAASGNVVHLAANPNDKVRYWAKTDSAGSWPSPATLGDAPDQSDYSTASIAVGSDGSVYVSWVDRGRNRIYLRRTTPGTGFGERRTVARADNFAVFPRVGVATTGEVFVVWNADKRMRYRVSRDGGSNWSSTRILSTGQDNLGLPFLASGPEGTLVVAHGTNEGQIYASIWNGSTFDTTRVDRDGNYSADPSAAVGPDGTVYVAWRGVEDGEVWYSERQDDGSWPNSRLARSGDGRGVFGKVSISADQGGNLYASWISDRDGGTELYAAFKAVAANWVGPQRINVRGFVTNVDGAATLSGFSFGNIVFEAFDDGVKVRFTLLQAEGGNAQAAGSLVINGDAPLTTSQNVNINLDLQSGGPNEYQLSSDGVNFTPYAPIPDGNVVPWDLGAAPDNACVAHTVFGRIRNSERPDLASGVLQDSIVFDPGINVTGTIRNPYLTSNPAVFSEGAALMDNGADGARDGDPRYTREKAYFLEVQGLPGECSNLTTLQVGNESPVNILNNYYSAVRALPVIDTPAENLIQATVTDGAGYQRTFEQTIYYDSQPPLVTPSGTPEVVDASGQAITETNSIVVTLSFEDMTIADNLYGKNGEDKPFWGVWIANSTSELDPDNPEDEAAINALNWLPVSINSVTVNDDNTYTFTVPWSLFSGLPKDQWQGGVPYYTYARVLDGAGNSSETTLRYQVSLSAEFQLPELNLPLVAN